MANYKGFTSVELRKPKRSMFDLSHENRLTTVMGRLTPFFISETLPNDTFRNNSEVMIRLAPLLAPIMHRVNVFTHFFFVPMRLLWEDTELFFSHGRLGTETPPEVPNISLEEILTDNPGEYFGKSTLADYLGMGKITDAEAGAYADVRVNVAPFLAYNKIWMDYYRDRNYQEDDYFETPMPVPSGQMAMGPASNNIRYFQLKIRHWEKDYFTSALPFTQRGSEVMLPLEGTGLVTYLKPSIIRKASDDSVAAAGDMIVAGIAGEMEAGVAPVDAYVDNIDSVELTSSDVSINDFREAITLQRWLERQALGGSRMNETIYAHFARKTSDSRLQRAEYLGGGKINVKISEVLTTAFSEDDAANTVPPASMAGRGISFGSTNSFTYNCEEWGFVIGIMSVMPTSAYMQGSHRMFFNRSSFLDYPWPTLAHLGEQQVYKYELYQSATNTPADRNVQPIFGYQSRYADWKYIPSQSHGDFKETLDFWHATRKFASSPTLGGTFVTFDQNISDRLFAVSDVDTLWCYIYNNCSVLRSLPYFGTPI